MTDSTNPMATLDDVLEGRIANGIHPAADTGPVDDLGSMAASNGWRLLHLDCAAVTNKAECLAAWSTAAQFPDWVGNNWDALADALSDLSWLHAEGYVVLLENEAAFREASPSDASTAQEIVREVASVWDDNGTPFVVLTRQTA